MFKLICVTNRVLCKENFFKRIEKIASAGVYAIILREKDLSEEKYEKLAVNVMKICENSDVKLILHNFTQTAIKLNAEYLHLPLEKFSKLSEKDKKRFKLLGASCHSVKDVVEAEKLGATYVTAGHIFDTDCKKDLPGRGLDFLRQVSNSAAIPVYAIGGISPENVAQTLSAGAKGTCVMSEFMRCDDVLGYMEKWMGVGYELY